MQDRYTADVGDFGKYGLIRSLTGPLVPEKEIKLGIHWYLTEPEDNGDGRHLEYLDKPFEYRICDPELFDFLEEIKLNKRPRSVYAIENGGILPPGTCYFSEKLSFRGLPKGTKASKEKRIEHRDAWIERASNSLSEADVVFLDPDTGLERRSYPYHHFSKGPKYAFHKEIALFVSKGQSVIIYQHQAHEKFEPYLSEKMRNFKRICGDKIGLPYCCVFRSNGYRAFIILPIGERGNDIINMAKRMMQDSNWANYFTGMYCS